MKHNPKTELLQLKDAMFARVHQEQIFGRHLDLVCENTANLSDKQRVAVGNAIASMLCDFMRQFSIDLHESGIPLTSKTRQPALNLTHYVRYCSMERLNAFEDRKKIIISGFNDRPRDPYAYRSMNVFLTD